MNSNNGVILTALMACLIMAGTGCTGEISLPGGEQGPAGDSPETQDLELLDGTSTDARPEIGQLYMGGGMCTATLITSRAVVTAKHCVGYTSCNQRGCGDSHNAKVYFEGAGGAQAFPVDRFVSFHADGTVPEGQQSDMGTTDSNRSDYFLNDDVALLLLKEDVPSSVAQPAPIAKNEPTSGSPLTVWGYGCTDRRGQNGSGQKRYTDFSVGSFSGRLCPGDSGGPVTVGRDGAVAFVNSAYMPSYNGMDVYGDVTLNYNRIASQLAQWGESLDEANNGGGSNGGADNGGADNGGADNGGADNGGADNGGSSNGGGNQDVSPLVFRSNLTHGIPDGSGIRMRLDASRNFMIDKVEVAVDFDHPRPSDLEVTMTAPDGQRVALRQAGLDETSGTYGAPDFVGKSTQGEWALTIYDIKRGQRGAVNDIGIAFQPTSSSGGYDTPDNGGGSDNGSDNGGGSDNGSDNGGGYDNGGGSGGYDNGGGSGGYDNGGGSGGPPSGSCPTNYDRVYENHVVLSCDPVPGATSYVFEVQYHDGYEWVDYHTFELEKASKLFWPQQCNTAYRWRARAQTSSGVATSNTKWNNFIFGRSFCIQTDRSNRTEVLCEIFGEDRATRTRRAEAMPEYRREGATRSSSLSTAEISTQIFVWLLSRS